MASSEKAVIGDNSLQQELDILKEAKEVETFWGPYEDLTGNGKEEVISNANPSEVIAEEERDKKRKAEEISNSENEDKALEALLKRQKEEEDEDKANCVVCLTEKKNILFVPCK